MKKALEYCIIGTLIFNIIIQLISLYFSWKKDTDFKCDCPCKEKDKLHKEFIKLVQLHQYALFKIDNLPKMQTSLSSILEKPKKDRENED